MGDSMKTFQFQNKKQTNYFEGWYYRLTDVSKDINIAIIFAITKDVHNPHSFIQYYNGIDKKAHYYTFDVDKFHFDDETNTVHIGDNYLSSTQIFVHTDDLELAANTSHRILLDRYQSSYSAMGLLSKAPLECFQEVIYLDGHVEYTYNGVSSTGKSYMEKTYGTNFPSKWIWLQSNHSTQGSSITFSVGLVPVLFFHVKGFFLIYRYNNVEHRYGSFNLSRIKINQIDEYNTVFTIRKRFHKIQITASTSHPVSLVGPRKNGIMDLSVLESLDATATMTVFHHNKQIFEDTYNQVGLELMFTKKNRQ